MITPSDPNFQIYYGATVIHKWTKESLMNLNSDQRPTLDIAWKQFEIWLSDHLKSLHKPVILCAFNGFKFDFMILMKNLDHYGI